LNSLSSELSLFESQLLENHKSTIPPFEWKSKCQFGNNSRGVQLVGNPPRKCYPINNQYVTVLFENPIPIDNCIYRFSIHHFHKPGKRSIFVGIAPESIDTSPGCENWNKSGWWCASDGNLYSGPPHNYCGKSTAASYKVRDNPIINGIFDTSRKTLSFMINGIDIGVAYENIPIDKPLFPAVILYYADSGAIIIDS
jgi:hypothetical protein